MKFWIYLLLGLCLAGFVSATVVFSDDAESGVITDKWNDVPNANYTTDNPHSGSYSIRNNALNPLGDGWVYTDNSFVLVPDTLYRLTFYFYLDRSILNPSIGGFSIENTLTSNGLQFFQDRDNISIESVDIGVPIANGWHKYEFLGYTTNGTVSIDDVVILPTTDGLWGGLFFDSFGTNNTFYLDDVVLEENPVIIVPAVVVEGAGGSVPTPKDSVLNQELTGSPVAEPSSNVFVQLWDWIIGWFK